MKTTAAKHPIHQRSPHRSRALAPARFSHIRLADGRFVPVLAGGMVETAINALGGVLREVDPVSCSLPEQ